MSIVLRLRNTGASQVALGIRNPPANAGDVKEVGVIRNIPYRRIWQPTPVFLPGKSHGQGFPLAWQATVLGVTKSQKQLKRLSTKASRNSVRQLTKQ